jgi:hypothetical protein
MSSILEAAALVPGPAAEAELPSCARSPPPLRVVTGTGHLAACHLIGADGSAPDISAAMRERSAGPAGG